MELKNIEIGKRFIFGNVIFTRISDKFTNDGELFIGCRLSNSSTVYIVDNAWVEKL